VADNLVTVATFWSPIEANLARNRLEAAGLRAFLAGEESVGMAWYLTNAFGGIKLQVRDEEAQEAHSILAEGNASSPAASRHTAEALSPLSELEQPGEPSETDVAESVPVPTSREQNADRAFRGAVFGLLLLPLQLYVFWLLVKVFVAEERLDPKQCRNAVVAAIINLPVMLGLGLLFRAMLSG
jgi:hypothetical protein